MRASSRRNSRLVPAFARWLPTALTTAGPGLLATAASIVLLDMLLAKLGVAQSVGVAEALVFVAVASLAVQLLATLTALRGAERSLSKASSAN
jgi:hypothetical protein